MNDLFSLHPAVLWFIVGVVLVIAEFLVPGFVVIFFGAGALIVSLLCWLGWVEQTSAQLLLFSVCSLVMLFGLRWLVKGWFVGQSKKQGDSDEMSDIIGHEVRCLTSFSAAEPYGKAEFKGANWKARSSVPLSEGSYAIIEAVDGLCLILKPKS